MATQNKPSLTLASIVLWSSVIGCGSENKAQEKKSEVPPPRKVQPAAKTENRLRNHIAAALAAANEEQYYKRMSEIFERAREMRWTRTQLVGAIIDYSSQVSGAEELGRYNRMLNSLDIPRSDIVAAAAASLDSAQGTAADAGRNLLRYAAPPDPRGRKDFSHFKPYLDAHASPPPARLVQWMYEHDPAAAMWQMREVYGADMSDEDFRALSAGEHVVSEILFRQQTGLIAPGQLNQPVIDQLTLLARYRQWWVRLYVVHVLLRHPQFIAPRLLDELKNDADDLVRSAASRLTA